LEFSDGSDLVAGVTWNANIVVAFEDELNIADFECLGASSFGTLASSSNDLVDKLIGYIEDALKSNISR
jgi:hypothetical protein